MKKCNQCGKNKSLGKFYRRTNRKNGYLSECKLCFKDRMANRHQENKDALAVELGGQCVHCGYNRCMRVLHFHHIDPNTKSFGLSARLSANISTLRAEAKKCMLLCPNCHAEKHQGLW
jgi:hypothetical protein